jgi:hypothetical protein
MALELDGNLSIERAHTRRWVSIIAVVIPVAAFVLLAAWFIRAFIVPPTVAIHNPTMMADAPPPPPAVPKRAMVEAPKPPLPVAVAAAAETPVKETPAPAFALPMFATLSAAPPSLPSTSPAFADPAPDVAPITAPVLAAEPTELEPSEPIAGPVPLPRAKRHAALRTAVPLPRPKPSDVAPEPDLPAIDRHGVN